MRKLGKIWDGAVDTGGEMLLARKLDVAGSRQLAANIDGSPGKKRPVALRRRRGNLLLKCIYNQLVESHSSLAYLKS